jgi:hypothetical protein
VGGEGGEVLHGALLFCWCGGVEATTRTVLNMWCKRLTRARSVDNIESVCLKIIAGNRLSPDHCIDPTVRPLTAGRRKNTNPGWTPQLDVPSEIVTVSHLDI